VNIIQKYSTSVFRSAPITQTGLGFGAGTSPVVVGSTTVDSVNLNYHGKVELPTAIKLSGTDKVNISLSLPAAIASPDSNSRIIVIAHGVLALGGSNLGNRLQ
jgi:hypothetical protein